MFCISGEALGPSYDDGNRAQSYMYKFKSATTINVTELHTLCVFCPARCARYKVHPTLNRQPYNCVTCFEMAPLPPKRA